MSLVLDSSATLAWNYGNHMIPGLFRVAVLGALWPIAVSAQPAPNQCQVHQVALSLTGGQAGGTAIVLTDGTILDGGAGTVAWDEPMQLRHADGSTCTVDDKVSIITNPIYDAGGRILYVTTYSGSDSTVFAVSVHNCRVRWQSHIFTQGPKLNGEALTFSDAPPVRIGADCLPITP